MSTTDNGFVYIYTPLHWLHRDVISPWEGAQLIPKNHKDGRSKYSTIHKSQFKTLRGLLCSTEIFDEGRIAWRSSVSGYLLNGIQGWGWRRKLEVGLMFVMVMVMVCGDGVWWWCVVWYGLCVVYVWVVSGHGFSVLLWVNAVSNNAGTSRGSDPVAGHDLRVQTRLVWWVVPWFPSFLFSAYWITNSLFINMFVAVVSFLWLLLFDLVVVGVGVDWCGWLVVWWSKIQIVFFIFVVLFLLRVFWVNKVLR